jgi:CBS domain-containing membrane protein
MRALFAKLRDRRVRLFRPILAGATLRDRLFACLGALVGIALTGAISRLLIGETSALPLIVAPIGASAVLLFAVPASPLAQPWAIIGGNTISALVGVVVGRLVPDPLVAVGVGVSLAIAVMSFARCLHPPGGAVALGAVLGGPAVAASGFLFPLVPVGLNAAVLVALGLAFHKAARRNYPHRAPPPANTHRTTDLPPQLRTGVQAEDIDAALDEAHEGFDIDRDDLRRLLEQAELHAMKRRHGDLVCGDIMSRDLVSLTRDATADRARDLMLAHNIRTIPVVDADNRLLGSVGLRELAAGHGTVGAAAVPAATTSADHPAVGLIPVLTSGKAHAVIVVDAERRVSGIVTQTDLLAALARARP